MIHIDRNRIHRPDVLRLDRDTPARRELLRATEFYERASRGQRRFEFTVYRDRTVRDALVELFHGKCAYCETIIKPAGRIDLEMFRPKHTVKERADHPGYWWLAMIWENMLPSCANCNRILGKANRFPVAEESERAFNPGEESREKPLLLDPCVDNPEEHLIFETTGKVFSETQRGQATISIMGLNRSDLIERRQEVAKQVQALIRRTEQLLRAGNEEDPKQAYSIVEQLQALTDEKEEFAGLKRQLIKATLARLASRAPEAVDQTLEAATPTITKTRKAHAKRAFKNFEQAQSSYSLKDEEGRERYRGQRRLIESITIKDLRAISDLTLTLAGSAEASLWLMLLGENGTGKSTILQATSITLLGSDVFLSLVESGRIDPGSYVRYGCEEGSISVKLSGFTGPHKLVFRENNVEFTSPTGEKTLITFGSDEARVEGAAWEPQTLVLAYGATRLLPRKPHQPSKSSEEEFSRVDNLFDPFVPLADAEAWLLSLEEPVFNSTARVLLSLLPLPGDAELKPDEEGKHIVVVAHGAEVPLRQLSDGYQGVVAMTVDILQVALRLWPDLQEAEGTVLLDEVGAHLHPTWKMRVVGSLRKALPAMQFLATTHDPLCLRGLGKGEVAVLKRGDDARVTSMEGLPSPGDFRVDQLLTSDFFGLDSTVDPDVEAVFNEYYALLALPSPDAEQSKRLEDLQEELKDRRHLGATQRESLMYEAIDRIMAQHKRAEPIPIGDLKQEAVAEIAALWNEEA